MSQPVSRRGSRDTTLSMPAAVNGSSVGVSAAEIQRLKRKQQLEEMQRQQEARVNMKRRMENGVSW